MKRSITVILLIAMIVNVSGIAEANICETNVSPMYVFIRYISVALSVNDGIASCKGEIRLNNTTSSISAVLTLYKQSGSTWVSVGSWNGSTISEIGMEINKTKSVAEGTYKVVFSGTVFGSNGSTEPFSGTSRVVTYP